jgi:hypothetical protein
MLDRIMSFPKTPDNGVIHCFRIESINVNHPFHGEGLEADETTELLGANASGTYRKGGQGA